MRKKPKRKYTRRKQRIRKPLVLNTEIGGHYAHGTHGFKPSNVERITAGAIKLPPMASQRLRHDQEIGQRSRVMPNVNLSKLAELTGVRRETVSRWVNGKTRPGVEDMKKVGVVLGMGLEEVDRLFESLRRSKN